MYGHDLRAETEHLRPADGGLEPGTVMESRVPVADWRVVTAGRQLEKIGELVLDDEPFDLCSVFRIMRRKAEFAEHREGLVQRCAQMHHGLADREAARIVRGTRQVADIAEAHDVELRPPHVRCGARRHGLRHRPLCVKRKTAEGGDRDSESHSWHYSLLNPADPLGGTDRHTIAFPASVPNERRRSCYNSVTP